MARVNIHILLTFIKLPFVIKIFVLSIFEWPFYTGFTVHLAPLDSCTLKFEEQFYNHIPAQRFENTCTQ